MSKIKEPQDREFKFKVRLVRTGTVTMVAPTRREAQDKMLNTDVNYLDIEGGTGCLEQRTRWGTYDSPHCLPKRLKK